VQPPVSGDVLLSDTSPESANQLATDSGAGRQVVQPPVSGDGLLSDTSPESGLLSDTRQRMQAPGDTSSDASEATPPPTAETPLAGAAGPTSPTVERSAPGLLAGLIPISPEPDRPDAGVPSNTAAPPEATPDHPQPSPRRHLPPIEAAAVSRPPPIEGLESQRPTEGPVSPPLVEGAIAVPPNRAGVAPPAPATRGMSPRRLSSGPSDEPHASPPPSAPSQDQAGTSELTVEDMEEMQASAYGDGEAPA